jgi:hypothetical protein
VYNVTCREEHLIADKMEARFGQNLAKPVLVYYNGWKTMVCMYATVSQSQFLTYNNFN